jgi:uncharacterized protein (TIGR02271 family)
MVLYKLEDFDSEYQDAVGRDEIKGLDVYTDKDDEKVGSVKEILVDESGRLRYLVVDTGFWIFGKQVLLPVGRTRVFPNSKRVYALGFTKEQAEHLPEFNSDLKIDNDYEERVRGVYRTAPLERSAALETSAPLDTPKAYTAPTASAIPAPAPAANYDRDTYTYEQDPHLYEINHEDQQTLKLYEERLVATKNRRNTGEVTIGKHVETKTAQVSVPIEKEQVVIERVTPTNAGTPVSPAQDAFREGEVARMQIYEETPDIRKETIVGEEVRIRKEVEQDTVEAQETVRREKLDINTQNPSDVDRRI